MTIAAYFVELNDATGALVGVNTRDVEHALTASERVTTRAACQAESDRR